MRKRAIFERAIADDTRAIELNPRLGHVYGNRAEAYKAMGDQDRALADFNSAIERDSKSAGAYAARSAIFASKGDYERAIADASSAIERNPKFAEAYVQRANLFLRKRAFDLSIADASKAIEFDSKNANAYDNRGFAYRPGEITTEPSRMIPGRSNSIQSSVMSTRIEPMRTKPRANSIWPLLITPNSTRWLLGMQMQASSA